MNFLEGVKYALKSPAFVREYNRLMSANLTGDVRKPIEKMVDGATGHEDVFMQEQMDEMGKFIDFFYEYVWSRLSTDPSE